MPADPEPVALDRDHLPVGPEVLARALGSALAERHRGAPDATIRPVPLDALVDRLRAAAGAAGDPVVEDGPYLGRSTVALADLLAELVIGLGPADDEPVPVVLGLTLGSCRLHPGDTVELPAVNAVADRHLDLAAVCTAMGRRHGPAVVAPLVEAYGFDSVDMRRLDTCQLVVGLADALGVGLDDIGR